MPEPVEILYVELAARADQLISDVEKAVATAEGRLKRIDESTQQTEGRFKMLGTAIKAAFGLAIVQQFLGVIQKVGTTLLGITQQAVGLASGMQGVVLTFNRLLGSEAKAQEFLTAIKKEASLTGQSVVDMAMAAKQFLPYAEGSKNAFLEMIHAQQALAAADPIQGMIGAAFALREFLSGSYLSLAQRFELPKKRLAEITKMQGTMEEKMAALTALLEEFGMGWGMVQDQLGTFAGQMGFLRGLWSEMLLEFGQPIFAELETGLKGVVEWVKENKEEIIDLAVKFGKLIGQMIADLQTIIGLFGTLINNAQMFAEIMGKPDVFSEWALALRQIGFIIDYEISRRVREVIVLMKILVEDIERLRTGRPLMGLEEMGREFKSARLRAKESAAQLWGFGPREAEEVAGAPVEEAPEEKAPPGLSEEAQKAALKGAKKIEDIIKDFTKGVQKIWTDYNRKLADIQKKADKDREKALKKAAKSEADAAKDYQKDLEKLRRDHNKEKIDEQEDFNKDWKRLIRDQHQEVIDAEWEFQYEEERLIAEGDTLALRDLRIRYQHEKDVRAREQSDARSDMQSDYQERRQDRERDFQEEMQERESQFQEKMGDIQSQLQEELATIAENAAEARTEEQMNYAERYEDLVAARDEKLQAVGEGLMSEKDMNTETANEIMALWAEVYGEGYMEQVQKGIDADQARRESLGLLEQQALETAQALATVSESGEYTTAGAFSRARSAARRAGRALPSRIGGEMEFAQHGLDAVFSRPTNIIVGEGGVAEHVKVTPLTGGMGGGRMDVNISGNINVTGSALSPEAANALIIKMSESVVEGLARRPE